uniref:nuclear pore complex protein Nup98-Nup96 isoform X3 n=1 Tax=Myxine glutinosa TaxID=7769 RepID=UPI00358FCD80
MFGQNKPFATGFGGSAFGTNPSTFGQTTTSGFGTFGSSGGMFANTNQNKPGITGGLFGSSNTFGQTLGSATTNTGFGATNTTNLFSGGGLFSSPQSNPTNAFGQTKPAVFGFNTSAGTPGSLFGSSTATVAPFGGSATTSGTFGAFGAAATKGTTIKFNPLNGTDTMLKAGCTTTINTKHQCISAMKEYESKSLEELRWEDYSENRKGPQQGGLVAATGGLFGSAGAAATSTGGGLFGAAAAVPAASSAFSFGPNKMPFGAGSLTATDGSAGSSLFGQVQQQQLGGLFGNKPFGVATTTQPTAMPFGSATNTAFGQPAATGGLFGTAAAARPGGLFSSVSTTTAATGFGTPGAFGTSTGQGLFGAAQNTGFGAAGGLFANKPAGFAAPNTSTTGFGATAGGLFGAKPGVNPLGTSTTSAFGYGLNTLSSGGLFGNKTATGLGAGLVPTGQSSLFGGTQPSLGAALGGGGFPTFSLGGTGGMSTLGSVPNSLGAANAGLAAQQAAVQQQMMALVYSPYGDSPLFQNLVSNPQKTEELVRPTNPVAQRAFATPSSHRLTPRPAVRLRPRPLKASDLAKSQLFDGLDDEEPTVTNGTFQPRKSVKKLVIKSKRTSLFPLYTMNDNNGFSSASQLNGLSSNGDIDECKELPIPPGGVAIDDLWKSGTRNMHPGNTLLNGSLDNTIAELDVCRRVGVEGSSGNERGSEGSSSLLENSVLEEEEEEEGVVEVEKPPHPAGVVLMRYGYYTAPSLDKLAQLTNDDGDCIVSNFTIGREGYGSILFPGEMNVRGLDLDALVQIRRKEVIVYPNDDNKPILGTGLNRRAEVTLLGVWPVDKTTGMVIKNPERLSTMGYQRRLERVSLCQGTRFLDYQPETGSWIFEVSHFSKYGLPGHEDDVDDEHLPGNGISAILPAGTAAITDAKKPRLSQQDQTMPDAPQEGELPPLQKGSNEEHLPVEADSEMADITQEPIPENEWELDDADADASEHFAASHHIAASFGMNTHRLQVMKASFAEDRIHEGVLSDFNEFPWQASQLRDLPGTLSEFRLRSSPAQGCFADLPVLSKMAESQKGATFGQTPLQLSILDARPLPQKSYPGAPSSFFEPRGLFTISRPSFAQPPPSQAELYGDEVRPLAQTCMRGLVPSATSLVQGREKCLADAALFMGRSFRVGWGPGWILCHCGDKLESPLVEDDAGEDAESPMDAVGLSLSLLPAAATPPKRLTDSRFRVWVEHVDTKMGQSGQDVPTWDAMREKLEIALEESDRVLLDCDNEEAASQEESQQWIRTCPGFRPREGIEAIRRYCHWVEGLVPLENNPADVQRQWRLVWTLCEALWGQLHEMEMIDNDEELVPGSVASYVRQADRREALSCWLERAAEEPVEAEVSAMGLHMPVEGVFSCLSGRQVSRACKLAQCAGDHRLALLLSQAIGSEPTRQLLSLQLAVWARLGVDLHILPARLRVYSLLAGKPIWHLPSKGVVNVCGSLDWKRAFATHLWYMLSPVASITDALQLYEKAFQGEEDCERYAPPPLPPHMEQGFYHHSCDDSSANEAGAPVRDACFLLLKLYSDWHHDLQQLCDPSAITADPLDYRLSWHLWMALQGLDYTHLSVRKQGLLHASYASQLEAAGLWEWAVFVLLHINDAGERARVVHEVLGRHCTSEADTDLDRFLTERLGVPAAWLHLARAHRAHAEGYPHREAIHFLQAEHYNDCHRLVLKHIASDAVINGELGYLKAFLEVLGRPQCSSLVQDWEDGGGVFLEYIRVTEALQRLQAGVENEARELEAWFTSLISLGLRLERLPCLNCRDKLCQAEMANRVTNMLHVALSLRSRDAGSSTSFTDLLHSLQHLSKLPLTDDSALENLSTSLCTYNLALTAH